MSLTANISPANMALTGNPIKLSINSSSLATYTILVGEQTISPAAEKATSLFLFRIYLLI